MNDTTPTTIPAPGSAATQPARETFRMKGIEVRPVVTAADSGGALSVLEQRVEAGAGSPPHRCHHETKVILVLDGAFNALQGEMAVPLGPGEAVVIAPGMRHNYTNVGDGPGRVLVTLTPGGHEDFLRGLAAMGGPAAADPVVLAAHCAQHGVDLRA